jgi:hypothetical protein
LHGAVQGLAPVLDSLEGSTLVFNAGNNLNLGCLWLRVRRNLNNSSEAITSVKGINRFVDLLKAINVVSDKVIDFQFTNNNLVNKLRNILPCLPTTESGTFPASASHKLEWSSLNFFSSSSDSNNAAFTETSVSSLKSSSHDCNISSAIIGEINTPLLL